jgi:hypothetical protein
MVARVPLAHLAVDAKSYGLTPLLTNGLLQRYFGPERPSTLILRQTCVFVTLHKMARRVRARKVLNFAEIAPITQ